MSQSHIITIALAGNPNSGKTTIFNNLTGTRQKVGNWPGVTVEKKEGMIHRFGLDLKIVDLPGTYSLTPFSIEEIVARNFILDESPDVVINIIDASNLERSLYLATQMRELNCKVLFALNMADLARERGIKIDGEKLSQLLNLPVVFTVGNRNKGIDELLKKAVDLARSDEKIPETRRVKYSSDIEIAISKLKEGIEATLGDQLKYNSRWTAIKLLENDRILKERIQQFHGQHAAEILEVAEKQREKLRKLYQDEPEIVMTDERYGFIAGIVKEVMTTSTKQRVDISRNIDLVLTNRFLGFPIFIFFIWAMFQLTYSAGAWPMEWIETGVEFLAHLVDQILPDSLLKDMLVNGAIAGVGSVVVFLPNILILFFCIALFEDTGYMARAAFLMDKIMHLIGLHGKSFIPMLMGFGCNVPAIMAARTLESEKDRILTILITPFMSCSARLPVYIILAGTFFDQKAGTVIFTIYVVGIVVSMITGRLFRSVLLRGQDAPFVMELPPYRMPMLKSLLIHMWDRSRMFLRKMGGIILVGSIIIWTLSAFPRWTDPQFDARIRHIESHYQTLIQQADASGKKRLASEKQKELAQLIKAHNIEKVEHSYLGMVGRTIAPVFAPLGIEWKGAVALLSGLVAKEIVVSTLGILYVGGDEADALKRALQASDMTPLSALAMMIFVLLYIPCLATVTAVLKETGSGKWMLLSIGYSTTVAWLVAFLVYQGGQLLGMS